MHVLSKYVVMPNSLLGNVTAFFFFGKIIHAFIIVNVRISVVLLQITVTEVKKHKYYKWN